jgi:DUF2934 family protein
MTDLTGRIREAAQAFLERATNLQGRIRDRAYAIWEREGRPYGRDRDHWAEAEREISNEESEAAPKRPTAKKKPATRVKTMAADASARPKPEAFIVPATADDAPATADDAPANEPARQSRGAAKSAARPRRSTKKKGA